MKYNKEDLKFGKIILNINDINDILNLYDLDIINNIENILLGDMDDDINHTKVNDKLCFYNTELFNYIYYNLKWSKEFFISKIVNSFEFIDYILLLFDEIDGNEQKMSDWWWEDSTEHDTHPEGYIIIKYPSELKDIADKYNNLEFLSYSKIDNKPIYKYKINIPEGFDIILPRSHYLKMSMFH